MGRCSSRRTQKIKNTTRNLELGGGLEGGDGDYVIGIEGVEEQVSAKGGRTHCGRPHEARSLLRKIAKNRTQVRAGPRHVPRANLI